MLGSVSKTQEVIDLLEKLEVTAKAELLTETQVFEEFLDFCKVKKDEKAIEIDNDNQDIESANGKITEAKARIENASYEYDQALKKQNEKSFELSARKKQWVKDEGKLNDKVADLEKALSSIGNAITHIQATKPSLVSLGNTIKQNLLLADALGLSSRATSFLSKDPPGDYEHKSGGIIKVLETLETEFTTKLTEVKLDLNNQNRAFTEFRASITDAITAAENKAEAVLIDKNDAQETKGRQSQMLTNAQIELENDSKYHKDLTQRCTMKEAQWEQRKKSFNDEIAAIESALTQLATVEGKPIGGQFMQEPKKNVRAVPESKDTAPKAQIGVEKKDVKAPTAASFLQTKRLLSPESPHDKAAAFLLDKGKSLKSFTLLSFASQMSGPFEKVKRLIQNLVERLEAEASNETGYQSRCDVERKSAEHNRDYRLADINSTKTELERLSASESELIVEIDSLEVATAELQQTLKDEAEMRKKEKEDNMQVIQDAKEGLVAIQSAIKILSEYYKGVNGVGGADTATVLTQASPVDEEGEWQAVSGVRGAYKGAKGSGNIFVLLGVIKSNFENQIRETQADEKLAQEEYVKQKIEDSASLAAKTKELEYARNNLKVTTSKKNVGFTDLESLCKRMGGQIKILDTIWEQCVSIEMSWEEREAKIQEEVGALKEVLKILGGKSEN